MDSDMSRPVPGEPDNLALHVEMCALRHGQTIAEIRGFRADLDELKRHAALTKRAMWVCGALLLSAVSGGAVTADQIIRALQIVTQTAASAPAAPASGVFAGAR